MAKVAFLGLGVMGYPMAGHLAAKGHEVRVYNRTAAKAAAWSAQHGGATGATPAEAAAAGDTPVAPGAGEAAAPNGGQVGGAPDTGAAAQPESQTSNPAPLSSEANATGLGQNSPQR